MEQEKKKSKLKIIIPIAIVIIAVVGIVIFMNKDKGTSEETKIKDIKIGETFINGEWEYTITSIEYDYILDNINKIDGQPYKDYLTPKNKNKKTDYSKIDLENEAKWTMNPYCSESKESKYAVVSVKCKYNGKNEFTPNPKAIFEYDGYTFEQKKLAYSRTGESWTDFSFSYSFKPLPGKETIIYYRIVSLLPTNITEDKEKPLVLTFSDNNNNKFNVKFNNEEVTDYTK